MARKKKEEKMNPFSAIEPSEEFVVSGTIQNNTQAPISPDTRVVVVWVVSSASPDRSYVFGEGSLDPVASTFRIGFSQPPPLEALNAEALGVGIIVVTTGQSIEKGDDISNMSEVIGMAGQHAVIYVNSPEQAVQDYNWPAKFETGYGVGAGVKLPGPFDGFKPVDPSSVVLIIDDLENIEVVNWT
jgi:hypothetical protein